MRILRLSGAAVVGLTLATSAAAQPAFEVSLWRTLDSSAGAGDRGTTAGSLRAERRFAGERLRVYYDLDAGAFSTPGDWTFSLHRGGATYRVDVGDGGSRLFLGGAVTWRENGTSWAAAGYRAAGAFANLEARPASGMTWRAGYRFDVRRFPDYAELDQAEHDTFTSALLNLPTRTTLIGEVHVGFKSYDALMATAPAEPGASSATHVPDVGTQGRGAARAGRGVRPITARAAFASSQLAGQVSWLGRVAQSIADRTGFALQYYRRHTFGTLPPIMVLTPALFFDDGVYDDPFASEQRAVSASLKQVFAGGGAIEGWGTWTRKQYSATPAYGLDGVPLPGEPPRGDRIWRAGAAWTIPFLPGRTGPLAVDVLVTYGYTRHESNDVFYTYRSHVLGIGTSISY